MNEKIKKVDGFPMTVFLNIEDPGRGEEKFFVANEDYVDFAVVGEQVLVAEYKLVGVKQLQATPVLTERKP